MSPDTTPRPPSPDRRGDALALAGLALLAGALFWPALVSEAVPFFRDLGMQDFPLKVLFARILGEGTIPYWNPLLSHGRPLTAVPGFSLWEPWNWAYLVLPPRPAFALNLVLPFAWFGWGIYACARGLLGCRPPAAGLAAALAMLAGPQVAVVNLITSLTTGAWIPWVLFTLHRAATRGGWWLLAGAASLRFQFAAGQPALLAQAALLAGLAVLLTAPGRREGARRLAVLAGLGGLVCLIALPELWPRWELVHHSLRRYGFTYTGAAYWSLHPSRLLEFLWPFPFGHPLGGTVPYWGGRWLDGGAPLLTSLYLGVGLPLLAGLGLTAPRDRWTALLGGGGLVCLLLALGRYGPLFPLWYHLPLMGKMRYPEKFLLLLVVCLALLAARALERGLDRLPREAVLVSGVGGVLGAGLAAGCRFGPGRAWLETLIPWEGAEAVAHFASGGFRTAALLVLVGVLLALGQRWRPGTVRAVLGLVLLADLGLAHAGLNPTWPVTRLEDARGVAARLPAARRPHARFYLDRWDRLPPGDGPGPASPRLPVPPETTTAQARFLLQPELGVIDGVHYGFERGKQMLELLDYFAVTRLIHLGSLDRRVALLGRYGVRHYLSPRPLQAPGLVSGPSIQPPGDAGPQTLFQIPASRERVWFPREVVFTATLEEARAFLADHWSEGDRAVFTGAPRPPVIGTGQVLRAEYGWNRVSVEVEVETPEAPLVLNDTAYPGWAVTVDHRPVTAYTADGCVRGVLVPQGRHTVRWRYRPTGRSVTWTGGLIGLGLLLGWSARRRSFTIASSSTEVTEDRSGG